MKCTRIQRVVLERDESDLSEGIRSHLAACPTCEAIYRRTCRCRRVIALKRYEVPSELRREACLSDLHDRLLELQRRGRRAGGYELHPVLRYGVAAAVVALAAIHFAAMDAAPTLRSPVTQTDLRSRTFEQFITERNPLLPSAAGGPLFQTFSTFPTNAPEKTDPPPSVFFVTD